MMIDSKHAYFYQCQAQMHICDVSFCDFVVCTFPSGEPSMFVKRIHRDFEFWNSCLDIASRFFRMCVMPELLGRAFTRPVDD